MKWGTAPLTFGVIVRGAADSQVIANDVLLTKPPTAASRTLQIFWFDHPGVSLRSTLGLYAVGRSADSIECHLPSEPSITVGLLRRLSTPPQ